MSGNDLLAIAPLVVLSVGILVLMLQIAFYRHPVASWGISSATLMVTVFACLTTADAVQVTPLLLADDYSQFFSLIFVTAAMVVTLLAQEYWRDRGEETEEFYLLLLLATLGAVVLAYSTHLASLLLGLELMGVALYAMIAYPDSGAAPLEAAIKYLVLSGAASAILLFGFALLYAATGSLDFATIGERLATGTPMSSPVILNSAGALIFCGLAFKLSLAPFHMWTPDVYEGAPAPVAGFLATVSKAAVFVALLRWYLLAGFYNYPDLLLGLTGLAITSMLVGNLLALLQQNTKRLLAYSSIAHMGYLLIIVIACGYTEDQALAVEAASYYLLAYIATTMAAFALIGLISSGDSVGEKDQIDDLQGLFWRQPTLALLLTLAMLSMAGIPLTAGFIGKFYIFTTAIDSAQWGLIAALIGGSAIGIFYYLRVVYTMSKPATEAAAALDIGALTTGRAVVYVLIYLILYLGIFPQPLMDYLSAIL